MGPIATPYCWLNTCRPCLMLQVLQSVYADAQKEMFIFMLWNYIRLPCNDKSNINEISMIGEEGVSCGDHHGRDTYLLQCSTSYDTRAHRGICCSSWYPTGTDVPGFTYSPNKDYESILGHHRWVQDHICAKIYVTKNWILLLILVVLGETFLLRIGTNRDDNNIIEEAAQIDCNACYLNDRRPPCRCDASSGVMW